MAFALLDGVRGNLMRKREFRKSDQL